MKSRLEDRDKAIELRKSGLSYKEIQKTINASKGLLSGWFKYLELSKDENFVLGNNSKERQHQGRLRASISNRNKRIARETLVISEATKEFAIYNSNMFFFVGICLYWAEGGKKSEAFQFVNSDPEMVTLMVRWIEKYLKIPKNVIKYRLYIHKPYANENCEEFWASKIGIPVEIFQKTVYKPTIHNVKKNPKYKGCISVVINKVDLFRKVMAWQKLLIGYYKE